MPGIQKGVMTMLRLIENVQVFRDGQWRSSEILTAGGQIERIADHIDCSYDSMERFDGGGAWALPGFIDQHVHITGGGGEGGFSNEVPPLRISDLIRAGTTTVVGTLGTDGTTRSVESVVARTKAIREEGLSAYCLTGSYDYPSPTITGSVRKDIVLLDEVIGVKVALADHRSSGITREELARLASEAVQGGILANKAGEVHIHTGSGRDQLDLLFQVLEETNLPATVFHPTHLGNKMEAALRFARLGGYIDFTAGEDAFAAARTLARALREAPDGTVTMSSDGNGSVPVWNEKKEMIGIGAGRVENLHAAVAAMVQKEGIPLEQAVRPCTENVAKALKLWPQKGCLAEGADADILLLDNDLRVDSLFAGGRQMLCRGAVSVPLKFEQLV